MMRRVPAAIARHREVEIEAPVDDPPFGPYTSVVVANVGGVPWGGSVIDRADPATGSSTRSAYRSAHPGARRTRCEGRCSRA